MIPFSRNLKKNIFLRMTACFLLFYAGVITPSRGSTGVVFDEDNRYEAVTTSQSTPVKQKTEALAIVSFVILAILLVSLVVLFHVFIQRTKSPN